MQRHKFLTIDIEGDISSKICREHFTEDTLYRDPNTIIWLCSFYNGKLHNGIGIRLPQEPRTFISPKKGTTESTIYGWHNRCNIFKYGIKDFGTVENNEDYRRFLEAIASVLNYCYTNKIIVFFKGFKKNGKNDAYDREQINTLMKKFDIDCHTECMVDINAVVPNFYMEPTHSQKGQRTSNQQYMDTAVIHNMEDSKKLFEAINKLIK